MGEENLHGAPYHAGARTIPGNDASPGLLLRRAYQRSFFCR
jgi:hypothetical protein